MSKSRIAILDGFRALAIIAVLFYHYFNRWTPPTNAVSFYPYGSQFNFFRYGNLGVHFFFIISGFVIFFTLDKTDKLINFWKKRLIRLVPSMIFASCITFILMILLDKALLFPESHYARNFLPSWTFINPALLDKLFHNISFDYINGSYWSLWPEIQFYFLSSALYYINKARFMHNFAITTILILILNLFFFEQHSSIRFLNMIEVYYNNVEGLFNIFFYMPFFSMGMIFYLLFKHKQEKIRTALFIKILLGIIILFTVYEGFNLQTKIVMLLMAVLFFLFIYLPDKMILFENRTLTKIGESSYFLYLIHENIGVLMIFLLGRFFMPFGFVFSILVMVTLTTISILFTQKIDNKINKSLKKKIIDK